MVFLNLSPYSLESNFFTGIFGLKLGSPMYWALSENALLMASVITCNDIAELWPISFRLNPSRIFSISITAIPPELGGGIEMRSEERRVGQGSRSRWWW